MSVNRPLPIPAKSVELPTPTPAMSVEQPRMCGPLGGHLGSVGAFLDVLASPQLQVPKLGHLST